MNKKKLAELIGILIGDGNIYYKPKFRKYYFEITGNPKLEKNYFNYVSKLIEELLGKKPSLRIANRGLRLRIYSKLFVEFLINDLKLPYNKNKGSNIIIPEFIYNQEWNVLKYCIRGIIDTDGCFFLASKGYRKDYPTIEFTTTSKKLALQLKKILSEKYRIGFRIYSRGSFKTQYIISLNGESMTNRYLRDIGFSNLRKIKSGTGGI